MSKEKKKEQSKYNEKLKIDGTLDDVLRVSVDKKKTKKD